MVNQAETPENTQPAADAPIDNSVGTTTDITEEFSGVNTFEDTPTPSVDEPTESEGSGEQAVPAPTTTPESEVTSSPSDSADTAPPPVPEPAPVDDLQRRMQEIEQRNYEIQQQNLQYQNQQQMQQLQGQADQYRQQLEQAGYLPDQASQISQNWMAQQNQVTRMQQEQDSYVQYLQGQANAAEHFANKYELGLSDLAQLRQHSDPQSMEEAAKRIQSDRNKDAEIAKLRAQLVPSQTFDDSQSTPAASTDEDRWLERYSQGDRSAQANAAARRAAGLT